MVKNVQKAHTEQRHQDDRFVRLGVDQHWKHIVQNFGFVEIIDHLLNANQSVRLSLWGEKQSVGVCSCRRPFQLKNFPRFESKNSLKISLKETHQHTGIVIKKDFGLRYDVLSNSVWVQLLDHLRHGVQCGTLWKVVSWTIF